MNVRLRSFGPYFGHQMTFWSCSFGVSDVLVVNTKAATLVPRSCPWLVGITNLTQAATLSDDDPRFDWMAEQIMLNHVSIAGAYSSPRIPKVDATALRAVSSCGF